MADLKEQGRAGLNRWGGHISEEWLPELSGMRGIRVYQEMADNDATVGAILFAIKMLIRQASWSVQAASTDKKDVEAAEFVESCLHDMQDTWTNTISEILSFLPYGWSLHELCYKRRMGHKKNPLLDSKHDDGLIGWLKLPIRCQESLYEWEFDESDNLTAFIQMPAPDYKIIRIPAEKFLLFRTESRKGNPEGRSILRPAYRSWYMKKRIEELEGIGIERDLAGFPVLQAPDGIEIWSAENAGLLQTCNDFVSNIRRDSMEGLTIPYGWELKLLSTGGTRQLDIAQTIMRYDMAIARTVLADFLFLGSNNVGSWALSSDKTALFSMCIGAYLDLICETFNRDAIPRLIDLNAGHFSKISGYPELIHGDVESQNLTELANFLKEMTGIGLITPDPALEDYLRQQASLPDKLDGEEE